MTNPCITLEGVSYTLPDGRTLFSGLTEQFDHVPAGLVGRNGIGKSVLARILAGQLAPTAGRCARSGGVYYLAQQISPRNFPTVAALAGVRPVLDALRRIEAGSTDVADFETVADRWDIRQRVRDALELHGLGHLQLDRPVDSLSGGEAMRTALLGAYLANADMLILDEPSNHLDRSNRRALMAQLQRWQRGLVVVSHDRELLEQMPRIVELSALGLRNHGGNYAFYTQAKAAERAGAVRDLERGRLEQKRQERSLRASQERQERRNARGDRQAQSGGQAKILLGRRRERGEYTSGKLQAQHSAQREQLSRRVREAADRVEQDVPVVVRAPEADQPPQRVVAELKAAELALLPAGTQRISLAIGGRQRIGVVGPNGCGKSTLLKTLAGHIPPLAGEYDLRVPAAYLDQQLLDLDPEFPVLKCMQAVSSATESVARMQLAQLGLDAAAISRPSGQLSGGERLKAALACALYADRPAQLLLLDEPSNHLDIVSVEALEAMLVQYRGALMVVSHDAVFLERLGLTERLAMSASGWRLEPW